MQSLYIDLLEDECAPHKPIHLGFSSGSEYAIAVSHVIINLKFSSRPVPDVLEELGEQVLPHF